METAFIVLLWVLAASAAMAFVASLVVMVGILIAFFRAR